MSIPTDLISTKEAAEILDLGSCDSVRYHINKGNLKGYKNRRGYLFVSKAEVEGFKEEAFTPVNEWF